MLPHSFTILQIKFHFPGAKSIYDHQSGSNPHGHQHISATSGNTAEPAISRNAFIAVLE